MTGFDKPVTRRTMMAYRFTVSGAIANSTGRRLVVELKGDEKNGDFVRIREEGRQTWVELDVAGLYSRGLSTRSKQ